MIGTTFFYHFTRFPQGNAAKHFCVSSDNHFSTVITFGTLLLSFFPKQGSICLPFLLS